MFNEIEKKIMDLLIKLKDKSSFSENFFIDFKGILIKPLSDPINTVLVYPEENKASFAIQKDIKIDPKVAFSDIRKKVVIFLYLIQYLEDNKYIYRIKHNGTNEHKLWDDDYVGLSALDDDLQKKLYELWNCTFVIMSKLEDLKKSHYKTAEEKHKKHENIRNWLTLIFSFLATLISMVSFFF